MIKLMLSKSKDVILKFWHMIFDFWFNLRWRWPIYNISGYWYWLKSHTYCRFHMLDIRSPRNEYDWGYLDADSAMFYACFALLKNYVEREKPFEIVDWGWNKEHKKAAKEIKELYDWWVKGRKDEQDELDRLGEKLYHNWTNRQKRQKDKKWKEYIEQVNALEGKDQKQLLRLIKIRHFLWT